MYKPCLFFTAVFVGVASTMTFAEAQPLSNVRQLTFEGKRAGEGYFNREGSKIIFQSEREAENPFYQIYVMDLELGDVTRVSAGQGKTTCAWIHPSGEKVLFASTHDDPMVREKMQREIDFRDSGQSRRYSWDYDDQYNLYEYSFDGQEIRPLTKAIGYDAEASWSPDGERIVFASNRRAFSDTLSEKDQELFDRDPSYLMDIYSMRADGTGLRQLTDVKGYDGGPFFSPDGMRICWRRFAENGATAEIFTMNADGSDQRAITTMGVMSWAPYWHPSGDYLIFTTNKHGFDNFELYMVDVEGKSEPVRVSNSPGFDGLPVFTPDGAGLAWTSNRTANKTSQIFMASWDDVAARQRLGATDSIAEKITLDNPPDLTTTDTAIRASDLRTHIEFLASAQMEGRRTGTIGERKATAYAANVFESLGLHPAGDDGSWYQNFDFTAGVNLGEDNELSLSTEDDATQLEADGDWRPLAFTKTGAIDPGEIAFAGYGIKAPAVPAKGDDDAIEEYDSFVHLDVADKWVMVFRYMPENIEPHVRQHFNVHSSLRYKASTVRDLGAKGLIVVSGPNSNVEQELVRLAFDVSLGSTSIAAISITDNFAQSILNHAEEDLKQLQDQLDEGSPMMGIAIPDVALGGHIEIVKERQIGRNTLARLYARDGEESPAVVIGAHIDHLGVGEGAQSLMRDGDEDTIHYGADDNASGVAGMLEIAQYLVGLKADGKLDLNYDLIFAAWSGEELNLLGSQHFVNLYEGEGQLDSIQHAIPAYLNLDMIGRMEGDALISGVGSSKIWPREIEQRNVPVGLSITPQDDTYLPTDATSFYIRGVPFLSAFTGVHEEYHSPRDTADKINYAGAEQVSRFMALVARSLASREEPPDYQEWEKPENMEMRANLRAYLGTIPDYAEGDIPGLKLSGVAKGGPADDAGLQGGDIITELAGRTIENIYDYTFAIEALKIGQKISVTVMRDTEELKRTITPASRE